MGARPARRRARSPEAEDGLARVRADRRAARLPLPRQRRGRSRPRTTTTSCASTTPSSTPSARRPTGGSAFPARTCPDRGRPPSSSPGTTAIPTTSRSTFDLAVERVVVIGVGNVALDIARMLALTHEELAPTDATDASIEAIASSSIREIVVVGRRGPAQAAFTTPELHEMGELAGADVVVDPADLEGARAGGHERRAQPRRAAGARRARAGGQAAPRRLPLLPVAGRDSRRGAGRGDRARPQRARRERTRRRRRTSARRSPCGLVFRSVGYRGVELPGVPFDDAPRRRSRTRADASSRASTAPAGSSAARPA